MANSIENMAYNSLLKENVRSTESDYSRGYLKGYEKGANAVLKELEKALEKDNDSEDLSLTCRNLYLKIRELKGEK